jgi:hypothetical protein
VDAPCEALGHFYENNSCIYCDARFCWAEHGGHAFVHSQGKGKLLRYCWQCRQYVVSITKD